MVLCAFWFSFNFHQIISSAAYSANPRLTCAQSCFSGYIEVSAHRPLRFITSMGRLASASALQIGSAPLRPLSPSSVLQTQTTSSSADLITEARFHAPLLIDACVISPQQEGGLRSLSHHSNNPIESAGGGGGAGEKLELGGPTCLRSLPKCQEACGLFETSEEHTDRALHL